MSKKDIIEINNDIPKKDIIETDNDIPKDIREKIDCLWSNLPYGHRLIVIELLVSSMSKTFLSKRLAFGEDKTARTYHLHTKKCLEMAGNRIIALIKDLDASGNGNGNTRDPLIATAREFINKWSTTKI